MILSSAQDSDKLTEEYFYTRIYAPTKIISDHLNHRFW